MIFPRYRSFPLIGVSQSNLFFFYVTHVRFVPSKLRIHIPNACTPFSTHFHFKNHASYIFSAVQLPSITKDSSNCAEASPVESMKRLDDNNSKDDSYLLTTTTEEEDGKKMMKTLASSSSSFKKEEDEKELEIGLRMYGNAVPSLLSLEERFSLITSVGECVSPQELRLLLEKRKHPICYDGFEPSGRMHIAQGILKALNVNKLTQAGCIFVFWVADWFGLLNNKMGGDIRKIQRVGEYFIEVWKAVGMDMRNVRFIWASEEINKNASEYWLRVMTISREFTISRIKRCSQIMGRTEGDEQPAAQILYPCMQCSDIFQLKADICQLGLDQRKVNMLAREYSEKMKVTKPIILSHTMLPGLKEGQDKMSKSDPSTAIYMEDTADEVNGKIKRSFCPPCQLEPNPCVAYVEMLVFCKFGYFHVKRSEQNGGDVTYTTIEDFRQEYMDGRLHPADLKANLARCINEMIEPVKKHFATDSRAKELLSEIRSYQVSR